MTIFAFLGALALGVLAFELASAAQNALTTISRSSLPSMQVGAPAAVSRRPSTWAALLLAIFPRQFNPERVQNLPDVISLLRRAGYPYNTPGAFYAAAMRTFSAYLVIGGLLAGALVALDMAFAAPVVAAIFIFLGLRRPYARLKMLAKRRAESMRNNMLIGLSVLDSLLSVGTGLQEALRRTANVGGPFCNLLGLLVARMDQENIAKAIETTQAHLPDPMDIEAQLFLRDVQDHFEKGRQIGPSVSALREAIHRQVVETTEARASLVARRAGLFGFLAVLGLVIAIIAPFAGAF